MAEDLRSGWEARKDRAHLIRYEDLVAEPADTVARMLEYLGVDSSQERVDDLLRHGAEEVLSLPGYSYEPAEIATHRTRADLSATVGRWRDEDDAERTRLTGEAFGAALAAFGYE
jgi:hypothetical protein